MSGLVFMSYARTDAKRVGRVVDLLLSEGIDVWWDDDMAYGQRIPGAIDNVLDRASCVVTIWTKRSVTRDWVLSESDRARRRGVLIPVLLDPNLVIPMPFDIFKYFDLTKWSGRRNKTIDRLVASINNLSARKTYSSDHAGTVVGNRYAIEDSTRAATELAVLTTKLGSLKEVFISDQRAVQKVGAALSEVRKTHRVVMDALKRFVSPAIGRGAIDPDPYLELESGVLISDIRNGRGHCSRILTLYGTAEGLRDLLYPRLSRSQLGELDDVFERLSTADGDLFEDLEKIGRILTNESKMIVNLLVAGQQRAARQRIKEARQLIGPVRDAISEGQSRIEEIQTSLGFAA